MLADLESWKEWAGVAMRGQLRAGEKVESRWNPPGSRLSFRSRSRVAAVEPPYRFRTAGTLLSSRVLAGERVYELEPLPQATTRMTNSGRYEGLLFAGRLANEAESFALQFNQRLKKRVEGG